MVVVRITLYVEQGLLYKKTVVFVVQDSVTAVTTDMETKLRFKTDFYPHKCQF